MKKICFVVYDLSILGGAEQVAVNIANALCKQYKIKFFSICNTKDEIPYELDKEISVDYGVKENARIRVLIRKVHNTFVKYVNTNAFDVVISIGAYPGGIISLSRFFTKAKYMFCDHGALMNQWHEKSTTLLRWISCKSSHKTVVLTDTTKKDYMDKFHIPEKKITRIYNWIEPKLQEMEHLYNADSKKILSVGRFAPEKGYELLVEVAEKVLPDHPSWEWHVYGDGEKFTDIEELVKQKQLEKQLILKGRVQNVNEVFGEYAMLVLTSYREGLPLVLLEAKIHKLPMISFDIQTGPNEIIDADNGFLIPPYDCDDMAEKVKMLIQDTDLRMKMSSATENGVEKFEYSEILKQWKDVIDRLIG